eukprot:535065_1
MGCKPSAERKAPPAFSQGQGRQAPRQGNAPPDKTPEQKATDEKMAEYEKQFFRQEQGKKDRTPPLPNGSTEWTAERRMELQNPPSWVVFTDENFNFTLEYPASWECIPTPTRKLESMRYERKIRSGR